MVLHTTATRATITVIIQTATIWLITSLTSVTQASIYGSVEPFVSVDVLNIQPLNKQPLRIRTAFAEQLFECGVVDGVIDALTDTSAVTTINALSTRFDVSIGGFMGSSNPTYSYTILDNGPNAASSDDINILTNSLGYVLSQDSVFLLDADDPTNLDFPANYVVLNFAGTPALDVSAALFDTVGTVDPELYNTDSSGFTQFGRAYLSLQSAVPDAQFIAGYVQASNIAGVEYTPVVNGKPALFQGGAAFPGNNWTTQANGEAYLARIPTQSHAALSLIRQDHLRVTQWVLREIDNNLDRQIKVSTLASHLCSKFSE